MNGTEWSRQWGVVEWGERGNRGTGAPENRGNGEWGMESMCN